jgi:3',5'-cyclic AMP phosphodiesterase CpdA
MKFLHLSDTHVRIDYQTNALMSKMFDEKNNPIYRLKQLLEHAKEENFDFALITGDLVHEGEIADYELFKQIWHEYLPEVPYYFCRGNHDRRTIFMEGMNVQANEENEYIACDVIDGLRIIRLNSAQDEHHEGKISLSQMNQLADWLKEPAEKGTILLQHHPLIWEEKGIATEVPDGFKEIIANSDILGIFVGHIHQGTTMQYAGKMQYMTEAISFGVDEYPDQSIFTDRTGYNSCSLTEDGLFVYHHYLSPLQTKIGSLKKPFEGNF